MTILDFFNIWDVHLPTWFIFCLARMNMNFAYLEGYQAIIKIHGPTPFRKRSTSLYVRWKDNWGVILSRTFFAHNIHEERAHWFKWFVAFLSQVFMVQWPGTPGAILMSPFWWSRPFYELGLSYNGIFLCIIWACNILSLVAVHTHFGYIRLKLIISENKKCKNTGMQWICCKTLVKTTCISLKSLIHIG